VHFKNTQFTILYDISGDDISIGIIPNRINQDCVKIFGDQEKTLTSALHHPTGTNRIMRDILLNQKKNNLYDYSPHTFFLTLPKLFLFLSMNC